MDHVFKKRTLGDLKDQVAVLALLKLLDVNSHSTNIDN